MNVLVVQAHPLEESFNRALRDTVVRAVEAGGHDVTVLDLYAEDFDPRLSEADRRAYHGPTPIVAAELERHVALVRTAEALVFVYPTWWFGMPAILKGWLDRVLVPGVAFVFDERTGKVRPGLTNVRRIIGVTTYGSPWLYIKAVNDAGRRTLLRTLRIVAHRRCRTAWLGLYALDRRTDTDRAAFLAEVDRRMRRL